MSNVASADQSTILKQTNSNLNSSSGANCKGGNSGCSNSSSDSITSGNYSIGSSATDYAVHGTQQQQQNEHQFKEDQVEDQNYLDPQHQLKLVTLSEVASVSQATARDFILKESRFQTTNEQQQQHQGNCMILNELSAGQKSVIVEANSAQQTIGNRQQQQQPQPRQSHCQCLSQQQQQNPIALPLQQSCSKNLHHLRPQLTANGAALGNQQQQREASQLNAPVSIKYQQQNPSNCDEEGTNVGCSSDSSNSTSSSSVAPGPEGSPTVLGKGIKRPASRASSSDLRLHKAAAPSAACGGGGTSGSNQHQAQASSQTSQASVSERTSGASNPQGGGGRAPEELQVGAECSDGRQHQQQQEEEEEEGDSEDDLNFDYEPVLTKILNEKKLALLNSPDVIKFLSKLQCQQKLDQLHHQNQHHQLIQPQLQLQHQSQNQQTEQLIYQHLHHNHHNSHQGQQPNHCSRQQNQQHINTPIGSND